MHVCARAIMHKHQGTHAPVPASSAAQALQIESVGGLSDVIAKVPDCHKGHHTCQAAPRLPSFKKLRAYACMYACRGMPCYLFQPRRRGRPRAGAARFNDRLSQQVYVSGGCFPIGLCTCWCGMACQQSRTPVHVRRCVAQICMCMRDMACVRSVRCGRGGSGGDAPGAIANTGRRVECRADR